jgi:hypothetical protein
LSQEDAIAKPKKQMTHFKQVPVKAVQKALGKRVHASDAPAAGRGVPRLIEPAPPKREPYYQDYLLESRFRDSQEG